MPNHLANETSPYLRQHADDPVDWYPWGPAAFAAAEESGRPIFLSVGYASCHWCHVMHRESFADPATAARLNNNFVSIKVDRESRPDVDEHYMGYVTAATGSGGWPMSVFLTPALVPFFGGTYFPSREGLGMPTFGTVLEQVSDAYRHRRESVDEAAEESMDYLRAMFAPAPPSEPTKLVADDAVRRLLSIADPRNGGFGGAPKFPQAPVTDFLLAYYRAFGNERALSAAEATMEGIVRGGIYDQVGGGIARYSVDAEWLVPHFEKMLYDNAMLLSTLASLHRLSPQDEWVRAMRGTAAFLDRDLAVGPAFASSLDADTHGVEGASYVWSHAELAEVLDAEELRLAEDSLGVSHGGNWEGVNVLTRPDGDAPDATVVDALLAKLLKIRGGRAQPARDDKVIVAWNALAALGLMDAGGAIPEPSMRERGLELVRHLCESAVRADGGVLRLLGDPSSSDVRVLEDAAALAYATSRAFEITHDPYLGDMARRIFEAALDVFYDDDGTWYSTPAETELPVRPRDQHDGPTPSGPSLAVLAALSLDRAGSASVYAEIVTASLSRLVTLAQQSPLAAGSALVGVLDAMCAPTLP